MWFSSLRVLGLRLDLDRRDGRGARRGDLQLLARLDVEVGEALAVDGGRRLAGRAGVVAHVEERDARALDLAALDVEDHEVAVLALLLDALDDGPGRVARLLDGGVD